VSQSKADALEKSAVAASDRQQHLLAELQETRSEVDLLRGERDRLNQAIDQMRADYDAQAKNLEATTRRLADFQQRLDQVRLGELNPEVERAFEALAQRHPDMVQYDPERALLRFASDLTFDSGSAAVKPEAAQTLAALADILGSEAAIGYDVHVVGHTDSQPLSAATRQRHLSNRGLSCHRAIAVGEVLIKRGVPASRILTAGWGAQRPFVPNTRTGNTPQNRRVEIFLAPPTGQGASAGARGGAIAPDRAKPPARQYEPTK